MSCFFYRNRQICIILIIPNRVAGAARASAVRTRGAHRRERCHVPAHCHPGSTLPCQGLALREALSCSRPGYCGYPLRPHTKS